MGSATPGASLEIGYNNNWNAMLRVGVNGNRANTNVQLSTALAVLGIDQSSTSSVGAVAWDYYNNGNNPSWAGTLLLHQGTAVTGNWCDLPAANQASLIFQNCSSGVIATNGAHLYLSPGTHFSTAFLNNGNVLIGKMTQANSTYKLDVNGNVRANKVVVNSTGADFVFDSAYRVRPLSDVEDYVAKNHHLPDIQSAEEMKKEGMDVGEQSTKLLQKVEELTLYLIQQNKLIEQQARLLKAQQEKIDRLERRLKH